MTFFKASSVNTSNQIQDTDGDNSLWLPWTRQTSNIVILFFWVLIRAYCESKYHKTDTSKMSWTFLHFLLCQVCVHGLGCQQHDTSGISSQDVAHLMSHYLSCTYLLCAGGQMHVTGRMVCLCQWNLTKRIFPTFMLHCCQFFPDIMFLIIFY